MRLAMGVKSQESRLLSSWSRRRLRGLNGEKLLLPTLTAPHVEELVEDVRLRLALLHGRLDLCKVTAVQQVAQSHEIAFTSRRRPRKESVLKGHEEIPCEQSPPRPTRN